MGLEKALITNTVTNDQIFVLFNPEEYTVSKSVNFSQSGVPGLSAPIIQFVSGGLQTLEMELLLDTYEEHREGSLVRNRADDDVRPLVRALTDLMEIEPSRHAPPVLLFTWASLSFTCVLAQARQRYIMFLPDGTPVRARVSVTFNEFRNVDLEAKEVKRETADYSRVHEVGQGETLAAIAWRSYGDPALWRLIVPQLPYQEPGSGEVYGRS